MNPILEADRLYQKREAELAEGDHYRAGQTWAEFQKVVCANWPAIRAAISAVNHPISKTEQA